MTPEALIEAILAEPANHAWRLVYADYLDECRDPRGEFIRIQLALGALPADDPRAGPLHEREAKLLSRYEDRWSEPLRGISAQNTYRGGFIEAINIEAKKFIKYRQQILATAPIQSIRFVDVGSSLHQLLDCAELSGIAELNFFASHLGEELASELVQSPHLGQLKALNLGRSRLGDLGLRRLAQGKNLPQLEALSIDDNKITDLGIEYLTATNYFKQLRQLNFSRNEVTARGIQYVYQQGQLPALTRLIANHNEFGSGRRLVEGNVVRRPRAITQLDLAMNWLNPPDIERLQQIGAFESVRSLDFADNELGNAGAQGLANIASLAGLDCLNLVGNRIGDDGVRALARSPYLQALTMLDLRDNPIHDPGIFEFLNTNALPKLKQLYLPRLGITPKMRLAIAQRFSIEH